jgi:hypothetical protein
MKLPWELRRSEDREDCYLYVDKPEGGFIDVGITNVYNKSLDSAEARRMAKALLAAADLNDAYVPPTPTEPVNLTTGFAFPPQWMAQARRGG